MTLEEAIIALYAPDSQLLEMSKEDSSKAYKYLKLIMQRDVIPSKRIDALIKLRLVEALISPVESIRLKAEELSK